jgi:broad specificity phosphatase PhoE
MRHGRTSYNVEGRYLGQTNIPLCTQGIEDVRKIANTISPGFFSKIYSSEYIRAVETAEIIASNSQMKVRKSRRLVERNLGILDGQRKGKGDIDKKLSDINYTPFGGESVDSCVTRFSNEINNIVRNLEGNVLIVSHGGVINLYMKYTLKSKSDRIFLDNGSFHILDNMCGDIRIKELNISIR